MSTLSQFFGGKSPQESGGSSVVGLVETSSNIVLPAQTTYGIVLGLSGGGGGGGGGGWVGGRPGLIPLGISQGAVAGSGGGSGSNSMAGGEFFGTGSTIPLTFVVGAGGAGGAGGTEPSTPSYAPSAGSPGTGSTTSLSSPVGNFSATSSYGNGAGAAPTLTVPAGAAGNSNTGTASSNLFVPITKALTGFSGGQAQATPPSGNGPGTGVLPAQGAGVTSAGGVGTGQVHIGGVPTNIRTTPDLNGYTKLVPLAQLNTFNLTPISTRSGRNSFIYDTLILESYGAPQPSFALPLQIAPPNTSYSYTAPPAPVPVVVEVESLQGSGGIGIASPTSPAPQELRVQALNGRPGFRFGQGAGGGAGGAFMVPLTTTGGSGGSGGAGIAMYEYFTS